MRDPDTRTDGKGFRQLRAAGVFDQQRESRGIRAQCPHRARGRGRLPVTRVGEAVLELDGPLEIRILGGVHTQLGRETRNDCREIGGHEAADYNR